MAVVVAVASSRREMLLADLCGPQNVDNRASLDALC